MSELIPHFNVIYTAKQAQKRLGHIETWSFKGLREEIRYQDKLCEKDELVMNVC